MSGKTIVFVAMWIAFAAFVSVALFVAPAASFNLTLGVIMIIGLLFGCITFLAMW